MLQHRMWVCVKMGGRREKRRFSEKGTLKEMHSQDLRKDAFGPLHWVKWRTQPRRTFIDHGLSALLRPSREMCQCLASTRVRALTCVLHICEVCICRACQESLILAASFSLRSLLSQHFDSIVDFCQQWQRANKLFGGFPVLSQSLATSVLLSSTASTRAC